MTILNAWVQPDRAVVTIDTEGRDSRFGVLDVSKMVPLVHANLLLANRGSGGLIGIIYSGLSRVPCDFDTTVEMMPELALASLVEYERVATVHGVPLSDLSPVDQLLVAGWSLKAEQMQGWLFVRKNGERRFVPRPVKPWWVAPGGCFAADPAVPEGPADLERIARQQTDWHRAAHPGQAIGGRLISAEITRTSMVFKELCDLDFPALPGEEGASVT